MSMVTRSLCVRYTPDRPVFCSSCSCSVAQLWVRQAPLSMGFSRKEYLCGLPLPPLGDLPDPKISPTSTVSSSLLHCRWILYHWATGKAQINLRMREYMWVQMKQERLWTDEWLYVSNVYVRTYWTLSHVFLAGLGYFTISSLAKKKVQPLLGSAVSPIKLYSASQMWSNPHPQVIGIKVIVPKFINRETCAFCSRPLLF